MKHLTNQELNVCRKDREMYLQMKKRTAAERQTRRRTKFDFDLWDQTGQSTDRHRQTDRQTDRQAQTKRQTNRQTDRQTDKTDRNKDRKIKLKFGAPLLLSIPENKIHS